MLKRLIFWDFPRASWQYDIIVGVILAFIFLTPREWFSDQPRIPKASSVAMLPSENGSSVFVVDLELLAGVAEDGRVAALTGVLRNRTGNRNLNVLRVEPVRDSDGSTQGYLAFARP
jgi:hypothetical protein